MTKFRFRLSRGGIWTRCWLFQFIWGKGAGYIGGWTFYVARRCKKTHTLIPLKMGLTRNWNAIPIPWGF